MLSTLILPLQVVAACIYVSQQVGINIGSKFADPSRLQFFYYLALTSALFVTTQMPALASGELAASIRATPWVYAGATALGVLGALAACISALGFAKFPVETAIITSMLPFVGVPLVMQIGSRLRPALFGEQILEPYKIVFLGIIIIGFMGYFLWPTVQGGIASLFAGPVTRVVSLGR